MPVRYKGNNRPRSDAAVLRRARREARLSAEAGKQVPEPGADDLSVQELVKPDVLPRAQDGGEESDAGLCQQGKSDGPSPVQMGERRRGVAR